MDQIGLDFLQRDEIDVKELVLKHDVDFVSVPNVRKVEDVQNIRELLGQDGENIKLFARIESLEGLENYDSILQAVDGVILMRGALGMQLEEKLFFA